MRRGIFTLLLTCFCLLAWPLADLAEARGGGRGGGGRGGGGFSRGGGGGSRGGGRSFGSVRNSARPATRNISRPATRDIPRPSAGTLDRPATRDISRPSQGQASARLPSQLPARGGDRPGQGQRPSQLPAADSGARPSQRDIQRQRTANLTPDQKAELRQKLENSGLRPSQLPSRDRDQIREDWEDNREDWQDWRNQNREDWQDWYDDRYDDYWDDHWHSHWWYGYPVSTVSFAFYIDDTPPCQKTVIVNQTSGSTTYYYCDSMWYQPAYAAGEVKYVVTSPPAGAELTTLADPYELTVGGQKYFVSNHAFFQQITRNGQTLYVTVDAPSGAMLPSIPEYAVEIEHQGQTYYRFDRIFYQRQGNYFEVVDNPGV